MPQQMKPPHYEGIRYNGQKVAEGKSAEVADRDVDALTGAGWTTADATPKKRGARKPADKKD